MTHKIISATLVIHPADSSTDFLAAIYRGRGFDVYAGRNSRKIHAKNPITLNFDVIGREDYTFVVEIDEQSLIAMGARAAVNKKGRAQCGGMVARITSRIPRVL